jgi:hypothetical protein
MLSRLVRILRVWWKKHIVDVCPPELEDEEFSEKYR